MENLWLFYWLSTVQSVAGLILVLVCATIVGIPALIGILYLEESSDIRPDAPKDASIAAKTRWKRLRIYWFGAWVVSLALAFIPSQKQVMTIVLGSMATSQVAQQIPPAILKYLNKENAK